jgi:hypothetical protein
MTINNQKVDFDEFAVKFIDTLSAGLKQMAEKAAANNESLVIGYKDGTSASVPAKDLLETLSK